MPWKETDAMDQKLEFVTQAMRDERPFAVLCREFGITPKTGYKWKERFVRDGLHGLAELSRRPHNSPAVLDENCICELIRLRNEHSNWGPDKIRELYRRANPGLPLPALSTVQRILSKAGLVKRRRKRQPRGSGRLVNKFEPSGPNQLFTVDFKGHWYNPLGEKVLPLTVCDAFSRFVLLAELVPDGTAATVKACFERLFEKYGLPLVIRSDNGSPFASSSAPLGLSCLSVWWLSLGIGLDRIAPGHPEQNGRHERMHRDIAMEIEGRCDGDLRTQQAALDIWRQDYNEARPHAALGMAFPAELYRPSERRYIPQMHVVEYPLDFLQRKVRKDGSIKINNRPIGISTALRGWEVGLQICAADRFKVWFGPQHLGELNLRDETFAAADVEYPTL